jgi:hypothetical protein
MVFNSPKARVGIFVLLNNSHHYALVEECTIYDFHVMAFASDDRKYTFECYFVMDK